MYVDIIQQRLATYQLATVEHEVDALKEILQEIALYALSTTVFFREACFHGGTALRILYQLPRFSEDLDFMLLVPNKDFRWSYYAAAIMKIFKDFGIEPEMIDRSSAESNVQKIFLKDHSIGKILNLKFRHHPYQKLSIKFEIDINPPLGAYSEVRFLNFPLDFSVAAHDLPSCFAGKLHAVLCRKYTKGRDWYDLNWYIKRNTIPNFNLLKNAIEQYGPWQGRTINMTSDWLIHALSEKIKTIDWSIVANDVAPFLSPLEKNSLKAWGYDFFMNQIQLFEKIL